MAINHDPVALSMHALNHPKTLHLCESVWDVDPIEVTGNRPVALVWLSPDCKHFSRAKGGTPVKKHIRGLAWVALRWAALTKPRLIALENVIEFTTWGPLVVGADGKAYPDPDKKGVTFQSFVRQLRAHGYQVDWRELVACDHGAPTIRRRLFLIARRDGLPIVWPEATHGDPDSAEVISGNLAPWRSAAECIDFDHPSASLFGRKKDLVPNTLRRVAKGLWRHVLTNPAPYLVPADGEGTRAGAVRLAPTVAPLRGTSEAHMGGHAVEWPLSAISAGGTHHALVGAHLVAACLEQANGGFYDGDGRAATAPMSTITSSGSNQRLVKAYCVRYDPAREGRPLRAAACARGVSGGTASLVRLAPPALSRSQMARARACARLLHQHLPEHFPHAVDLVLMDGWVLVDISLRMLKPRELYRAQAFPESYLIDAIPDPVLLFKDGKQAADPLTVPRVPLTAEAQVRMCGNSVSPIQAEAVIRANFAHELLLAA